MSDGDADDESYDSERSEASVRSGRTRTVVDIMTQVMTGNGIEPRSGLASDSEYSAETTEDGEYVRACSLLNLKRP